MTRGGRWAGPARWAGQLGCTVTGRAEAGPATGKWPRYGSFSLSLFLIISVFYYSVNLGLY